MQFFTFVYYSHPCLLLSGSVLPIPHHSLSHCSIPCILSLPSSLPSLFSLSTPKPLCVFVFFLSLSQHPGPIFSPMSVFVCQPVIPAILQCTSCTLPPSLSTMLGISLTSHSPLVDIVCHTRWVTKLLHCLSSFLMLHCQTSLQF